MAQILLMSGEVVDPEKEEGEVPEKEEEEAPENKKGEVQILPMVALEKEEGEAQIMLMSGEEKEKVGDVTGIVRIMMEGDVTEVIRGDFNNPHVSNIINSFLV